MLVLMKTEFWKLKRYHMVWAGVFLMLLSVLLTVFSTTAQDGSVWTFSFFVEQVLKNNITTIFPMCIALITGYIISREGTDDTLKNILTVPLSFPALLAGKLAVCGLLSLFLGIVSTVFTVMASSLLGFPGGDFPAVMQAGLQITANCLLLYIAVLPIIAIAARIPNGHLIGAVVAFVYGYGGMFAAGNMTLANLYPVTASMGLIGYRSYDAAVHWNPLLCMLSLLAALLIAAAFVATAKKGAAPKTAKKPKRGITKKGWKGVSNNMKKRVKITIGVVAVLLIGLVGFCAWFLSGSGSTEYYAQIDNTKVEQVDSNGGVINFKGGLPYSYTLLSYDENGNENEITFGTSRELREGAFIRLTVMPARGVLDWSEVQYDELPAAVQNHYSAPSDDSGN